MDQEERCDDKTVILNARLNNDEMIIKKEEYNSLKSSFEFYEKAKKEMEAHIKFLEKISSESQNEKKQILVKLDKVNKENLELKLGFISFIKILGGKNE